MKGNLNDGITSKDGLIIAAGNITVTAVDDGIRGKDYLVVQGGTFTVTAQGDGLKADNAEEAGQGYIAIAAGKFTITSGGDAIQAETNVTIQEGTFATAAAAAARPKTPTSPPRALPRACRWTWRAARIPSTPRMTAFIRMTT